MSLTTPRFCLVTVEPETADPAPSRHRPTRPSAPRPPGAARSPASTRHLDEAAGSRRTRPADDIRDDLEPARTPPGRGRPRTASLRSGPRTHVRDRRTPLIPGSVRHGAREAAARRRAELVVRIAVEVFDGHRPLAQLAPYASPGVLRYVGSGVPRRGTERTASATVQSVHCHPVSRTAAEVAAVCRFGTRPRALAARLDLTPTGDWRCTAFRIL